MAHLVKFAAGLLIFIGSAAAISFREQPESNTLLSGETVKLHCSVNNQVDISLYWQNLDTAAYISSNQRLNPYGQLNRDQRKRYRIVGNAERGEYHLQINNVSKVDEGRYACVFFLNFNYYSQVAKLRVVRAPSLGYPKCAFEPIQRPNIGDNITFICESRGGDPPATLSWIRGTSRLVTQRGRHSKGDPILHYSYTLTEDDSDVRFTCVANNPALQHPRTCSLTPLRSSLGVLLRPVVASVEEGNAFTFTCISERVPNLAYQWYINNQPIDGREQRFTYIRGGQRLLIEAVTMEDDYALVKCEVVQKKHGYTGSAVGLLWVQSNNIETPNVILTTTAASTTERQTTTATTTPKSTSATTQPDPQTETTTTVATTTNSSPPTTTPMPTIRTTATLKKTTPFPTTIVTSEPLRTVKELHSFATLEESATSNSISSDSADASPDSFSSVSSLSSDEHEIDSIITTDSYHDLDETETNDFIAAVQNTTELSLTTGAETIETELNEVMASGDTQNDPNTDNPKTDIAQTDPVTIDTKANSETPINVSKTTTSSAKSSTELSNAINDAFVTPSTHATVVENDIVVNGVHARTTTSMKTNGTSNIDNEPISNSAGDDIDNKIESIGLAGNTDTSSIIGGKLPNEVGVGFNANRARGSPNWGLIAGLFVVFVNIVVAISGLSYYLYRKSGKESQTKTAT